MILRARPENHPDVSIRKEVPLIVEGGVVNSKMSPMQKPTASESLEKPLDESRRNLPEFTPGGIDVHQEKTSGLNFPEKSLSPISLPEPKGKDGGGGSNSEILGDQKFSNIDDLLARSDALTAKTAPILMPTDLLFEYDASVLKDDATKSLKKLGELIKKNAQSSFRIEGHTDSFGSEEYNDQLSLRRAVAVKDWLIQNANIDPRNIATAGLGKRHLLVPASGNVQEQQLNRRVEIVITTR